MEGGDSGNSVKKKPINSSGLIGDNYSLQFNETSKKFEYTEGENTYTQSNFKDGTESGILGTIGDNDIKITNTEVQIKNSPKSDNGAVRKLELDGVESSLNAKISTVTSGYKDADSKLQSQITTQDNNLTNYQTQTNQEITTINNRLDSLGFKKPSNLETIYFKYNNISILSIGIIVVSESSDQKATSTWASGNFTHLYLQFYMPSDGKLLPIINKNLIESGFLNSNSAVIEGVLKNSERFQFKDEEFKPKKEISMPIVFEFILNEEVTKEGSFDGTSFAPVAKASLKDFSLNVVLKLIITIDGYIKLSTYNNLQGILDIMPNTSDTSSHEPKNIPTQLVYPPDPTPYIKNGSMEICYPNQKAL